MVPPEDFASLFTSQGPQAETIRRLRKGEVVRGRIVQIGADAVYVDVGTPTEARLDRAALLDTDGTLKAKVGDIVEATVIDARANAPVLSMGFGRGTQIDATILQTAMSTRTPVAGRVKKAGKSGLEVEIGPVTAFCPASQIELGFVESLEIYEGQEHEFIVLEIRDGGRSVVVSRRAVLEQRRRQALENAKERLTQGSDVEGVVSQILRHGALIDIDGVEGFVHVSELAHHRVERIEDVVTRGQNVLVRVLGFETTDRGERLKLSIRQATQPEHTEGPKQERKGPAKDAILEGTVVKAVGGGLIVRTPQGDGFVPQRELELAPGADHRRAYPVGTTLRVVVRGVDPSRGRLDFSVRGVAAVEERQNFANFSDSGGGDPSTRREPSLGSLGELLQKHLKGLPKKR